ncbi:3'-5' exoribonuclease YhaM family protein [Megalodesulfovibrio gigas]|nr:HD domain-containing protein [Megalodesulfovibrio gigas]
MIKEQALVKSAVPASHRKDQFVAELVGGQQVADVFVLAQASRRQARNGPFWSLTLQDATGQLEAKLWSPQAQDYHDLRAGQIMHVTGRTQMYQDKVQLSVEALRPVLSPETRPQEPEAEETPWPQPLYTRVELADLVPISAVPPETLLARLEDLLREHILYPPWRRFVFKVLGDPEIRGRLLVATGAKSMHHAYVGGLLEHTLGVVQLCAHFCRQYPRLDKDVLLAAAAFHDIGKAWELVSLPACDYTTEGRLLGHIQLGLQMLEPYLQKMKVDADLVLHFKHIVISHHGEYEYGSPKRPKTAEAFALHFADNLDAKMNQVERATSTETEEEPGWPVWSEYQRGLDRFLCRPRPTPGQAGEDCRPTASAKEDQCSLLLKG